MSKEYKKFDDQVKEMIRASGDPYLFPELRIPRSTARYWINGEKKKVMRVAINHDRALLKRIDDLSKELELLKAENLFLNSLFKKIVGIKELFEQRKNKEAIVYTFLKFQKWISINKMCHLTGITSARFFNFKLQVVGCEKAGFKKCKIVRANQISFREQEMIFNLAEDKKLRHLSIRGLHFHAFREKLVTCSYDSWLKYIKVFGLRNEKKVNYDKKYRRGIRAKRANEIWHMDISEFVLKDGRKAYLQIVLDNFSRKVISYQLSHHKDQLLSIRSIDRALGSAVPVKMMTDGGGENVGLHVRRILLGKGVISLIAQKDIYFSNSMVESFFRTLKMRFVDDECRYKFSSLHRKISRSVDVYNEMPYGDFYGATPFELYSGSVSMEKIKELFKVQLAESIEVRKAENSVCFRKKCEVNLY